MGRNKISRFYRGARNHAKWDLGTPPNPRGRNPFRPAGRKWTLGGLLGLVMFLAIPGPVLLDAASLTWRDNRGCTVWMVTDGDTVRMNCPVQGFVSGRIIGIDTPEMKARCPRELGLALAATFYLRWQIWTAHEVTATPRGMDRYGRTLILFGIDGAPITDRMTGAGLARRYGGGRRAGWCGAA